MEKDVQTDLFNSLRQKRLLFEKSATDSPFKKPFSNYAPVRDRTVAWYTVGRTGTRKLEKTCSLVNFERSTEGRHFADLFIRLLMVHFESVSAADPLLQHADFG
jgi:hypothetical protein